VEGIGTKASFMSEQSLLYLRLLGEYTRATKRRHKPFFLCMHQHLIRFRSFDSAQIELSCIPRSAAAASGFCCI
jgi:hypothetical protein